MLHIPINDLREMTEKLLNHLEEIYGSTVDLPVDYYWDIPDDQLYDLTTEPRNANVGQLSEDWEFLSKLRHSSDDPLSYGIVWLANILRAIGNTHIR